MRKILTFDDFLLESEQKESYGVSRTGSSPFVLVAPHANETDDEGTMAIALEMADKLNAFCVVNSKFYKPEDMEGTMHHDFNEVPKDDKWGRAEQKQFYDKVETFTKRAGALQHGNNKRALVLFLHALGDDAVDVDLGAGMKDTANMIVNAEQHEKAKNNSGEITAPVNFVEKLRDIFKGAGLKVGTGKVFSAWSEKNGTQYLRTKGIDCYSIQLELGKSMRKDPIKTADILSKCIKKMTDYSEPIFYKPTETK